MNQTFFFFNFLITNHCNVYNITKLRHTQMNRQLMLMSMVIPSLLILPLAVDNAHALKFFNQEINIEVEFTKTEFTNLESLLDDLDSGLVESNIHDEFSQIAVGTWNWDPLDPANPDNSIISDWSLSVNHDTGVHKLLVDPIVKEVNLPQGQNFASFRDVLVDEGRNIITSQLTNYGVSGDITWRLHYDGETLVVNETLP